MVNPTYHNNVAIDTLLSHVGADAHIGPPYAGLAHLPHAPFWYLFSCPASGGPLCGRAKKGKKTRYWGGLRFTPT